MKESKVIIALLGIIATFVVGVVLDILESILLPLVVATFLSYLFKPMVLWLKKRQIPTVISLLIVFVTIAGVLFGVSFVVYSSIDSFVAEAPKYQDRVNGLVAEVDATIRSLATSYGLPVSEFDWWSVFDVSSITSVLSSSLGTTVTFLGNVILVMLYMFFILASSGHMAAKLRMGFRREHSEKIATIIERIDTQVRQYILTKTVVSLITGVLTTLVLWIFGVDFALFWGFLAFLLNYIPNVGSLLAEVFPVLLAFLQFDSIVTPLIILIILVGMQTVMGNVVEPKMMAFSLNLSPLVILVALIFWGWLWGIVGMIIAVPMTAILKIIFENIDQLKPLARLMGGSITAKEQAASA
ncbi:MAG: AI-2E family transporter [Ignavibacteriae bacterium]|nr:AI-2E family transporter [Ignavibacteriota bacterium]MCB9215242.1 AI-2E family transporter [Ignavibacteria bacterium]